jgi:hypothetical protein
MINLHILQVYGSLKMNEYSFRFDSRSGFLLSRMSLFRLAVSTVGAFPGAELLRATQADWV